MREMKTLLLGVLLAANLMFLISCDENGEFLSFLVEDDKNLGEQIKLQIEEQPETFPVLDRATFPQAYAIMDGMLNDILNSGEVALAEEFDWEIFIIDGTDLSLFATPGGKIYVYTGIVYFLDQADDLMGALAHEVAHSDQRHHSTQLQRNFRLSDLLEYAAGGKPELTQDILGSLAGPTAIILSRDAENQADERSVSYLAQTSYACDGGAIFFQKLINRDAAGDTPEYLITHTDPADRVASIVATSDELGCNTNLRDADRSELQTLKDALP